MGRGRFVAFYLVCGLAASAAHVLVDPSSIAGGVAFWAHIVGFVAGVVLVQLFENPRLVAPRSAS